MALIEIVELGVAEAYSILVERFSRVDLPPLEAIENEDWGRDYLLSQFLEIPAEELVKVGLVAPVKNSTVEDRPPFRQNRRLSFDRISSTDSPERIPHSSDDDRPYMFPYE